MNTEALKRVLRVAEVNLSVSAADVPMTKADVEELRTLIAEAELREEHRKAQAVCLNLREVEKTAFYFGCIGQAGHFLSDVWLGRVTDPKHHYGCGPWESIDGKLAPYIGTEPRRGRSSYDNGRQTQGLAALHHRDGWTALAFWDRTVDTRMGCNSNFFFKGTHSFEEMVELAKRYFPSIWKRYPFDIVPYA
jgi:hypothetical protein